MIAEDIVNAAKTTELQKQLANMPERDDWRFDMVESHSLEQLTFNIRNPILADPAMRRALAELAKPEVAIASLGISGQRWPLNFCNN